MGIGNVLKEVRGKKSQLQIAMEFNVSREAISAYENERAKLPADISQRYMEKFDDPFFAMEVAAEYTAGTWVRRLNGENVDLHRASVRAKTEEELHEALEAISGVCVANRPVAMEEHERKKLEEALIQAIDAIVALTHYVAVICREYGFSWLQIWRKHFAKLAKNGYVKVDGNKKAGA